MTEQRRAAQHGAGSRLYHYYHYYDLSVVVVVVVSLLNGAAGSRRGRQDQGARAAPLPGIIMSLFMYSIDYY